MSTNTEPYRFFEEAVTRMRSEPRTSRPWSPAVDVLETEHELVLKADLPDVDLKDIDLQVENHTLTVKGHRNFERDFEGKGGYHRIERSFGNFVRTLSIPSTVDTEKVGAAYKNGVLTIQLPKKETAKPRQIKIDVANQENAQAAASK